MSSTLVTGGVRSGKSSWAVRCAQHYKRKWFLATASACDDDMKKRIQHHQQERGEGWQTVDTGKHLVREMERIQALADCIVIDCLTVWAALIMNDASTHEQLVQDHVVPLIASIQNTKADVIVVSNEVGMGVHPEYETGRQYRDLLGTINQVMAKGCDNVIFFIAGIPTAIKGRIPNES